MRAYQWLAAATVAVAFAAPAKAQVNLGGPSSQSVTFNVINPSAASATTIGPQQTGLFSSTMLQSFFHWPFMNTNRQTIGTSNFPAANATPGVTYLQGFGYSVPGQN